MVCHFTPSAQGNPFVKLERDSELIHHKTRFLFYPDSQIKETIGGTHFNLRLQDFFNGSLVIPSDLEYTIVEELMVNNQRQINQEYSDMRIPTAIA